MLDTKRTGQTLKLFRRNNCCDDDTSAAVVEKKFQKRVGGQRVGSGEKPFAFESMSKFGGILVRSDNSYALVVGISRYKDERIRELPYTDADAGAFSELLTDPRGAGFQKENVRLLLDRKSVV